MKKINRYLFCFIISLIYHHSIAQESEKNDSYMKHNFCLSTGITDPVKNFGANTFESGAGFGTCGFNSQIDYTYYIKRIFGANISLNYSKFGFDEDSYLNEYQLALHKNEGISVNSDSYRVFSPIIGLTLRTFRIKGFELSFTTRIGYSHCIHPEIIVIDSYYGIINSIKESSTNTFLRGVELKLNYYFNDLLGINFSFNKNILQPDFEDASNPEKHFNFPMNYHQFNLGIVYCL